MPPSTQLYIQKNPEAYTNPGSPGNECLKYWFDNIGRLFIVYTQLTMPRSIAQQALTKLVNHFSFIKEVKPWVFQVLLDECYLVLDRMGNACKNNHMDSTHFWTTFVMYIRMRYGEKLLLCPSDYVFTQTPHAWTGEEAPRKTGDDGKEQVTQYWRWDERGTVILEKGARNVSVPLPLHMETGVFSSKPSAVEYFRFCYGSASEHIVTEALRFVATFVLNISAQVGATYHDKGGLHFRDAQDPTKSKRDSQQIAEPATVPSASIPWASLLYYAQHQRLPESPPAAVVNAQEALDKAFGIGNDWEPATARRRSRANSTYTESPRKQSRKNSSEFQDYQFPKEQRNRSRSGSSRKRRSNQSAKGAELNSPYLQRASLNAPADATRLESFLAKTKQQQEWIVKRGVFIMILGLSEHYRGSGGKSLLDLMHENTPSSMFVASTSSDGMKDIYKLLRESKDPKKSK